VSARTIYAPGRFTGSADVAWFSGVRQCRQTSMATPGPPDPPGRRRRRWSLANFVRFEPRDQIEAMLAAQMEAAVYTASMTFVRRLANVENILLEDSAERAFNKLTRTTFPARMSALKEYR